MSTAKPGEEQSTVEEEEQKQAEAEAEDASPDVPLEAAEAEEPDLSLDKLRLRARNFPPERVKAILEGLLFVAPQPLPLEQMERMTGIAPEVSAVALAELQQRYQTGVSGIVLHEVAGGWQLRSGPESAEFVRRLLQIKPQRLTRPALETLAVIAYRQPVTRPEIEDIRGVDCGAVLKALLERKLIKILGKKEEPGHPLLYGTSREFLEFFNLKNLASLPTLREFQELSEEHRQIVEEQTGKPEADIAGTVGQLADPAFVAKQKETVEASERALEDLERAMKDAEAKAKETEELLKPPAPPEGEPGPEAGGAPPASEGGA